MRKFTIDDQDAFARLSGDYNPLHMDSLVARRYIFGEPVVHGIHSLLWAIDVWLSKHRNPVRIVSLKASFPRPVLLGQSVNLSICEDHPGNPEIKVYSGDSLLININLTTQSLDTHAEPDSGSVRQGIPDKCSPRLRTPQDMPDLSGTLECCLDSSLSGQLFPNITDCLPHAQIATLLCTTRLVGMECPGLYSLYSELQLSIGIPDGPAEFCYQVRKFDHRFGLATINFQSANLDGVIKAFLRPTPKQQADYESLCSQVTVDEFAGQRALIIGGSRGLGEVVAKLLSGGGADVKITFFRGEEDAQRIVDEITSHGGTANSVRYNVLDPDADISTTIGPDWAPTHLYYFATPFIFSGVKGVFSAELFNKFSAYYITGFARTVNQLGKLRLRKIYCPSSVAVEELPLNMGEYSIAKVACEVLCTFMEKSNRHITIHRPRLPRMDTDQTASNMPVDNADPIPIMISDLRAFRDAADKC